MRISDWSSDVCSSDLRTARPECRRLIGRHVTGVTEALAGSGTVEPDFPICEADRLEQVQGRDPDALHGLDRLLERQPNRALPGKVVNLVRPDLVQRLQDNAEVCDGKRYQPDIVMDAERLQVTERRGLRITGRTVDLITLRSEEQKSE